MEYRNELKFEVTDFELTRIYFRLLPLMQCDSHQCENGYTVRSLYFDDIQNSCMYEKEDGIDYRTKYRIRIYNGDDRLIRLEKKIKYRQMTRKEMQILTRQESDALLDDDMNFLTSAVGAVESPLWELTTKMLHRKMAPKCIVEYDRFVFVEALGNVRITFDRNVSGSSQVERFYDKELDMVPVMPVSHHILEVKFDEFLPQYILQAVDLGNLRKQSFSKYYCTRAAIG